MRGAQARRFVPWALPVIRQRQPILAAKKPRVLSMIPGNPATLTGSSSDRAQSKFWVEAAQAVQEYGGCVITEGTANSPVWDISPLKEYRKTLNNQSML